MARHILLVDDESSIIFAMNEYFLSLGYGVDCAFDREQAMRLLQSREYDAVIVDLRLSGSDSLDGLQVIAEASRRTQTQTRVILLTAFYSRNIEEQAKRRGATAVLQKPVALAELARVISTESKDGLDAPASKLPGVSTSQLR